MQRDDPATLEAPARLRRELLGVARMGVFVVDTVGCVSHWNHAAEELFEHPADQVLGQPLEGVCALPRELYDSERPWSGVHEVSCGTKPERTVAWWVYPLEEIPGARFVAFAADAGQLDGTGLCLAVDDRHIEPPTAEPIDHRVRVLRADPVMSDVEPRDAARLGRYLTNALPRMAAESRQALARRVLAHGYPCVNVIGAGALPLTPYRGAFRHRHPSGPLPVPGGDRTAPGREDAEAFARRRLSFLDEAAARIGDTPDIATVARQLTGVLVPDFADFASVELLGTGGAGELARPSSGDATMLRRLAVAHDDEPGRWDDTMPEGELLPLPARTPFGECVSRAEPVLVPLLDGAACDRLATEFGDRELRPLLEGRSLLTVPLVARGAVTGYVMVVRRNDRRVFDELDLVTVRELGRRAALCMDNADLRAQEARVAHALQHSMLPAGIPRLTGVEVAYRYRPGSADAQTGGDWFDAIPLGGSRVAFVAGDVMGHDLRSAAVMGQMRTAVRTLAALDLPPEQVLRHLDDLVQRLGEDYYATCVYAAYDPVTRYCTVVNAGHAAPVLVDPQGRGERLKLPAGAPVGVGGVPFEPLELEVPDGASLIFCTDGMVELRDAGLAGLCRNLGGSKQPLEEACDSIMTELSATERADDVALLIARLHGVPHDDVASWQLEADPTVVRHARALTRITLDAWGLIELADTMELLVSELVTNAVRHARGPVGLRLLRMDMLLCEVTDDDQRLPVLCAAGEMDEGGRGIHLVNQLTQRWGASRTAAGKVVWFEHAIPDG